jgi:hypothetical protein
MIPTFSPSWATRTRLASPSWSLPSTSSIRASGATTTWSPSGTMWSRTRWVGHCSLGTRRTPRRVNRPIVRPWSSTGNALWS